MELAWKHGYTDFAMPYFIQVIKEYTTKVEQLTREKREEGEKEDAAPVTQFPGPTAVVMGKPRCPPLSLCHALIVDTADPGFGAYGIPPVGLAPPVGLVGMPPGSMGMAPPIGLGVGGIPITLGGAPGSAPIYGYTPTTPPASGGVGSGGFSFM